MKDFFRTLNGARESHWEQALTLDSDDGMDGTECCHDESMLSAFRADFYLPLSSPTYDA